MRKCRIFHRPNPRYIVYPAAIGIIEQVAVAKFLGVFIHCNFKCDRDVRYILAVCSQRIYLLKLLRSRGLPVLYLRRICHSIIISRLIYTISVWGGFLSAELTGRIDAFLCRLFRCGYISTLLNIEDLLADADETLFIKVLRPGHCLHQLLPERKLVSMKLRPSNHSCQLPIC